MHLGNNGDIVSAKGGLSMAQHVAGHLSCAVIFYPYHATSHAATFSMGPSHQMDTFAEGRFGRPQCRRLHQILNWG